MLINLSNHSSTKWPAGQKQAAYPYGNIVDMPFPAINTQASTNAIVQLAKDYAKTVTKKLSKDDDILNAVHLMGEMTFSFALVSLLQKQGVACIASTTQRMVEEQEGQKLVKFSFVRFREYPEIY
ncbi:MAG: CRISPR-associated protein [Bacteroidota bacterium]|nr:CRISPR-associated protein [Bacteroidota bacterium]